ncbi:type II toxin-antitoxin system RelE/ParE family toxin [Oceanobacillus luteolus]|uniref:Type II toxin-antitoxin system RelE/ParE family toxin n=1 Tax=Oceanobacillus luteolus TaxID=1274358 RepID=A0ABW4HPD0_9BACI|nr:type II toxin-antitoxin system RelE/ParE family toxin [Oceanobacillus luteolus]MCM3740358.1 type II toxin-antitoxin system RelE/ParE family toxin [Oceanobacillus luteolus]
MPQKKIKYAPVAIDDMDEIFSYISEDDFIAAEKFLDKLNERIASLGDFPEAGTVLSDDEYTLVQQGYRFIVVHPYLIFYRIMEDSVVIHRIIHGRRDYLRELFEF